ncbi:MAG TPA: DUF1761 domain-containing protein [Flavobacteriaceae bacterium]|nr:DUF1761 domain-containing protein [Flavobacteriaceae bacterium]
MSVKNLSVSGIVGGVVNFLLGWLFYGMLFKDSFPQPEENPNTMIFIFLGCLTYSLFIAYIFAQWAQIKTLATGAKAGAVIGLFMGLCYNFFNFAMSPDWTTQLFFLDTAISVVMTGITGAAIAMVLGKVSQ